MASQDQRSDEFYLSRVMIGQVATVEIDRKDHRLEVFKVYPDVLREPARVRPHSTSRERLVNDITKNLNKEGTTILIVPHSPSHAERAHRIVNLLDGKVVPANKLEI